MLTDVDGLQLNLMDENTEYNYAYFPVIIDEKKFGSSREEVYEALLSEGIVARKYFYPLTNSFEAFHGKYDVQDTPVALHMTKRVLVLPIYPELEEVIVRKIDSILISCKR
jgi:dTDP-4-amino-4,6-dideoxygalactose transaminase